MSDWLFHETLTFGNPTSRVGLVTLWTHQKHYRDLDPALYHVRGNLYSPDGVNYIARNILAHPEIRALVICGSDGILEDTGVRRTLLDWRITDPMIPEEERAWLRENVRLVECERPDLPAHLAQLNAELANATLPPKTPVTFPFKDQDTAAFPSEVTGMRVIWSSIYDAWIDALRHVLRFGLQEGNRKCLLNLVSVIDQPSVVSGQPSAGGDEQFPDDITPERAQEYAAKFQSPEREPEVTYTYGNRMQAWGVEGLNLLEMAVAKLREDPHSSRCVIDLWDNRVDVESPEPPCLTQIILNNVAGDLYLTGFFRSHDLYRAYFLNLYALRRLQMDLARRLGLGVGKLTTISTHAHIYTWDLDGARQAVESAGRPRCQWDPRGNLALTRRDGKWVAILYAPDGRHLQDIEARSTERLLQILVDLNALSQPSHYVYVTKELLGKAGRVEDE
jgi:thymidylate synthase